MSLGACMVHTCCAVCRAQRAPPELRAQTQPDAAQPRNNARACARVRVRVRAPAHVWAHAHARMCMHPHLVMLASMEVRVRQPLWHDAAGVARRQHGLLLRAARAAAGTLLRSEQRSRARIVTPLQELAQRWQLTTSGRARVLGLRAAAWGELPVARALWSARIPPADKCPQRAGRCTHFDSRPPADTNVILHVCAPDPCLCGGLQPSLADIHDARVLGSQGH